MIKNCELEFDKNDNRTQCSSREGELVNAMKGRTQFRIGSAQLYALCYVLAWGRSLLLVRCTVCMLTSLHVLCLMLLFLFFIRVSVILAEILH